MRVVHKMYTCMSTVLGCIECTKAVGLISDLKSNSKCAGNRPIEVAPICSFASKTLSFNPPMSPTLHHQQNFVCNW